KAICGTSQMRKRLLLRGGELLVVELDKQGLQKRKREMQIFQRHPHQNQSPCLLPKHLNQDHQEFPIIRQLGRQTRTVSPTRRRKRRGKQSNCQNLPTSKKRALQANFDLTPCSRSRR